jgi:hypothetical protein
VGKLTDRFVKSVTTDGREPPTFRDADIIGFGVQVRETGRRSYARLHVRRTPALYIATRRRIDQRTQILDQARIRLAHGLATTARPAHPFDLTRHSPVQFSQSAPDRAACNPRGTHHCADPAAPGRRKSAPTTLVEYRNERLKPHADGRFIDHTNLIQYCES